MKIETNESAIDPWSIVHFVVPFALGYGLGVAARTDPKLRRRMVIGWFSLQVALFIGGLLIIAWEIGEQHNLFEWMCRGVTRKLCYRHSDRVHRAVPGVPVGS